MVYPSAPRTNLPILFVSKALCGTGVLESGEIKTGSSDCIDKRTKGAINCYKRDERRSEIANINECCKK